MAPINQSSAAQFGHMMKTVRVWRKKRLGTTVLERGKYRCCQCYRRRCGAARGAHLHAQRSSRHACALDDQPPEVIAAAASRAMRIAIGLGVDRRRRHQSFLAAELRRQSDVEAAAAAALRRLTAERRRRENRARVTCSALYTQPMTHSASAAAR